MFAVRQENIFLQDKLMDAITVGAIVVGDRMQLDQNNRYKREKSESDKTKGGQLKWKLNFSAVYLPTEIPCLVDDLPKS